MTFRIAVVQPISHPPGEDERNIADAVRAIEHAAHEGADFVCFPETYPGPWRMPATFDPVPAMAEAAATHGVHVVFGTIEPIDRKAATAHNLIVMAYPDGRAPARYRRTHPNGPWIYTGGTAWEFQYVAGNEFPVFDTAHGKVGLAMCSEVYMPEVTRALALRGAELVFMPAGTDKRRLWATWRTLIWARAIENLAVVVTTQNLFSSRRARARHGGGAGGDSVREHGGWRERRRRRSRTGALPAGNARRGWLIGQAAPPNRACSARNGSGRSSTIHSIRGRCAKRPSRRTNVAAVPPRPDLGPPPYLGYTQSRIDRAAHAAHR